MLKAGIMKFGIGRWKEIEKSGVVRSKKIERCYMQLWRLMGQQSMGGFIGLHVDIDRVYEDNSKIQGDHIVRKYGVVLINQGDKLKAKEKKDL